MRLNKNLCRLMILLGAIPIAAASVSAAPVVSTQGLIDWFDPDTGLTLDGSGHATGWTNLAAGNDVTVADPETSVVAGPNGASMIRFSNPENGAGLQYNGSGILTTGYTLFAAVRLNDPISSLNPFPRFVRTTNDSQALYLNQGNGQVTVKANPIGSRPAASYSSAYAVGDGVSTLGDVAILAARMELDRQALYFNGKLVSERFNTPASYSIGPVWEIGNSVEGDIGNVLMYGAGLTDGAFDTTGMALAAHYGVSWVATSPVVHWKAEGNLVNSGAGGSQYDGSIEGTSSEYVDGKFCNSQGLHLDGAYVKSGYTPKDSGTVALWYNPGSYYNYNTIFDNSANADDWEFWIYGDGNARFRVDNTASVGFDLDNLGTAQDWYHLAVTWERDEQTPSEVTVQLYVDGELRNTATGDWVDPGEFYLGGGLNSKGTGIWDDVRIYERVLSVDEISTLLIPEPSALMLLAFAVLSFVFRRRRSAR